VYIWPVINQLVICGIDFVHVYIFNLLINAYLSLIFIKYLINESRVKIKFLEKNIFCKENYTVVIIMRFLLHQTIIPGQCYIKTGH